MSFESSCVAEPSGRSGKTGDGAVVQFSRWGARVVGSGGLIVSGAVAASLLTWSFSDPGLSNAAGAATRNLLGSFGAILADLLMQTLGMASALIVLPIAIWAMQVMATGRIDGIRRKIILAPLAVLLIAGALSSLPTLAKWPLRHGFGGILGDVSLAALVSLLSAINAERAPAAAGLFYVAGGLAALAVALGLSQGDLLAAIRGDGKSGNGWFGGLFAKQGAAEKTEPALFGGEPAGTVVLRSHNYRATDTAADAAGRSAHAPMPQPYAHPQMHTGYAQPMPYRGPAQPHPYMVQQPMQPALQPLTYGPGVGMPLPGVAPMARPMPQPIAQPMPPPQMQPQPAFQQPLPQGPAYVEPSRLPPADAPAEAAIAARFAPAPPAQMPRPRVADTATTIAGALVSGVKNGLKRAAGYQRPPTTLLKRNAAPKKSLEQMQAAQRGIAGMLTDVLADFGIKGEMRDVRPGPVVTLFEFEPARGTKSSRVIGLADDIARHMSARAVRIAVVPGRNVIGIELPNVQRETVELREMLESQAFVASPAKLPITLGKTIGGEPVVGDLAKMPHLLVAGTTGSGKSVGVNAMIASLLFSRTPDECRFIMIDPKMLELGVYNGIPHLLAPVVTDPQKAVSALNWVIGEMERRYRRMSELGVRNIEAYNTRVRDGGDGVDANEKPLPFIVVVVDEFADLMAVAGKDVELAVQRIAQMARAAGIHMIMATQRPSVDVVTGTIKANFPARMSFRVASKVDSRTILNEIGAEQLLGQGDMLFTADGGQITRLHAPFVSDQDVDAVAKHLKAQGKPDLVLDFDIAEESDDETAGEMPAGGEEDLYGRALAIVVRDQKASTSYLQRRLQIGYNRAADLIERMEREGIVGPANHAGKRAILMGGSGTSADAAE